MREKVHRPRLNRWELMALCFAVTREIRRFKAETHNSTITLYEADERKRELRELARLRRKLEKLLK